VRPLLGSGVAGTGGAGRRSGRGAGSGPAADGAAVAAAWQPLGPSNIDGRATDMVVGPVRPDTVYAGAGSADCTRTTGGGTTWQPVLAGANGTTSVLDVAIDPTNSNRVFAVMRDHKRGPQGRAYGGVGSGVFRSRSWRCEVALLTDGTA
jgi:hypothetical protein